MQFIKNEDSKTKNYDYDMKAFYSINGVYLNNNLIINKNEFEKPTAKKLYYNINQRILS